MPITSSVGNARLLRVPMFPVGVPFPWLTESFPAGTMECRGQSFDKTAYPELAKVFPNGVLPDLRGVVLRGLDRGSGRDADGVARKAGDYQADQFLAHLHKSIQFSTGKSFAGSYNLGDVINGSALNTTLVDITGPTALTSTTGGTETRMKNVGCYWLVYVSSMPYDTNITASNAAYLGGIPASAYQLVSNVTGGMKNRLINGNFSYWQRGTNFTTTDTWFYTADRWQIGVNDSTGAVYSVSRAGASALGECLALRTSITTAGNLQYVDVIQRVEDVISLQDTTVTLSFFVKAINVGNTSKPPKVSAYMTQLFGTGGSSAISCLCNGQALAAPVNIGTEWSRVSFTFSIPTVTGKIFGAGRNLFVAIKLLAGTGDTVDIAKVQLEENTIATPFEFRHQSMEFALCQRYFETSYNLGTAVGYNFGTNTPVGGAEHLNVWGTSNSRSLTTTFKQVKYTAPTVSIYDMQGAYNKVTTDTGNGVTCAVNNISNRSFYCNTNCQWIAYHWSADAEIY